jgi:putative PIN family toxin of toxin-antitoxin system
LKVVFDTNVLVSAFAAEGLCARLLVRANRKEFQLFFSPAIRKEFEGVLEAKLRLPVGEIREALLLLDSVARSVDPAEKVIRITGVCRDETDHAILETAVAAQAGYIVSGDRDLLDLGEFRKVRIMVPRDFELLFD